MEAARAASEADLPQLAALAEAASVERERERGGLEWEARADPAMRTESGLAGLLGDGDALLLSGTFDGAVVGFARAHLEHPRKGGGVGVIDELFVIPDAREVGVGEALLTATIDWAAAQGCESVEAVALPGNRSAKNLFERFGLVARAIIVNRRLTP